MDILVLATKYSFFVGFAGMAAATLYFIIERNSLAPEYRTTASLAAVVTFVAAVQWALTETVIWPESVLVF